MAKVSFSNETRASMPRAIFRAIADEALPSDYELSVAFVPASAMQKFNLMYREKNEPTDILSFPLDEKKGEIYICPSETRRMAPEFDRSYDNFLNFLFIHGCVHLKGYDHGATMERIEDKIRAKFKV